MPSLCCTTFNTYFYSPLPLTIFTAYIVTICTIKLRNIEFQKIAVYIFYQLWLACAYIFVGNNRRSILHFIDHSSLEQESFALCNHNAEFPCPSRRKV
eukprot:sb/3478872/